ncbi:hypothetical protein [Halobacteriovorax sp. ZH2_bin.1]|uniref:hypothetical protein n=1 Tax=unclassified Halobacteriovorax TaxID=2639665 RepID=UPI003721EDC3
MKKIKTGSFLIVLSIFFTSCSSNALKREIATSTLPNVEREVSDRNFVKETNDILGRGFFVNVFN